MPQEKISVVINTYNAERYLRQCLEAVKEFDEIVVCDMESTDSTVAIAREYGCKIVTFPKEGYNIVEPARNFAIQAATHPWVLVVDADEIVTPELHDVLYQKIADADSPAGFFIPRQNLFLGMPIRDYRYEYIPRFLRREGVDWPPYIHSIPIVQGRMERLKANKNVKLMHLMDETMHEYIEKMNQYTDNEVDKKMQKGYGIGALLWRPVWRFFKSYVLNGSFRMGTRGFIRSMLAAYYQFVLVSKMIEKRYRD